MLLYYVISKTHYTNTSQNTIHNIFKKQITQYHSQCHYTNTIHKHIHKTGLATQNVKLILTRLVFFPPE